MNNTSSTSGLISNTALYTLTPVEEQQLQQYIKNTTRIFAPYIAIHGLSNSSVTSFASMYCMNGNNSNGNNNSTSMYYNSQHTTNNNTNNNNHTNSSAQYHNKSFTTPKKSINNMNSVSIYGIATNITDLNIKARSKSLSQYDVNFIWYVLYSKICIIVCGTYTFTSVVLYLFLLSFIILNILYQYI